MVEHYQKDADGLVTRLKVPVEKKSGKVEYSVDSDDFKKSKSGGGEGWAGVRGTAVHLRGEGVWGHLGIRGGNTWVQQSYQTINRHYIVF